MGILQILKLWHIREYLRILKLAMNIYNCLFFSFIFRNNKDQAIVRNQLLFVILLYWKIKLNYRKKYSKNARKLRNVCFDVRIMYRPKVFLQSHKLTHTLHSKSLTVISRHSHKYLCTCLLRSKAVVRCWNKIILAAKLMLFNFKRHVWNEVKLF